MSCTNWPPRSLSWMIRKMKLLGREGKTAVVVGAVTDGVHVQFNSVQSLSHVRLFATPWTAARQASLSITNSLSPPKPMSIESVMPSNHLILCRPLLLLPSPSVFPSIRVFSISQLFASGSCPGGAQTEVCVLCEWAAAPRVASSRQGARSSPLTSWPWPLPRAVALSSSLVLTRGERYTRHFGKAPVTPHSYLKPYVRSKGRKLECTRGQRAALPWLRKLTWESTLLLKRFWMKKKMFKEPTWRKSIQWMNKMEISIQRFF